ncbi:hypothetical protein WDV85_00515 [Pseudokineococcus sp. 5B2Z-1]|uniref:hypothetical protein n=1 Tax=Pseudokineococcus sp. 5B2Z-1 TaxID=3132744 RepID=UPI0030ADD2B4
MTSTAVTRAARSPREAARRLATAGTAALLAAATLAAPAAAASPVPGCAPEPVLKRYVSLDRPVQEVPVVLLESCDRDEELVVDVLGPRGLVDSLSYPVGEDLDLWTVTDQAQPGQYVFDLPPSGVSQPFTTAVTEVKYGSKAALYGRRDGVDRAEVRLTVYSLYYNGRRHQYESREGQRATIQILGEDGRTWQYLRTVEIGRGGFATFTLDNKYAATYRVVNWETDAVFPRTSTSVTVGRA